MTTDFRNMDTEHLGNEATEADLAEFVELCEQVQALHPDMDDDDVTDAVYGNGDYYRNAKKLGATCIVRQSIAVRGCGIKRGRIMHNIQSTLNNSLNDLLRMRDSYASAVVDCNYVVQLPGGFLRYTKDEGVSVRGLLMANSYTRERAEAVAAEASDGNGSKGAAVAIRDAISAELDNVRGMLSMLEETEAISR